MSSHTYVDCLFTLYITITALYICLTFNNQTAFRCKSPERFKPGWRSKRREESIGQAQPRHQIDAKREERKEKLAPLRMEHLQEREQASGVHPLTGNLRTSPKKNPYDGITAGTASADLHRQRQQLKQGKRLVTTHSHELTKLTPEQIKAKEIRAEKRMNVIVSEGLRPEEKKYSVRDSLSFLHHG